MQASHHSSSQTTGSPGNVELHSLPERVLLQSFCPGNSLKVWRLASLHQEIAEVLKLLAEVGQGGLLGGPLGNRVETGAKDTQVPLWHSCPT